MRQTPRWTFTFVMAVVVGSALGGCGGVPTDGEESVSQGISASRLKMYGGLSELSADSRVVLIGQAMDQNLTEGDIGPNGEMHVPPRTETVLSVQESVDVLAGLSVPSPALAQHQDIVVRQTGTPDMVETPAALLEVGKNYLLFLTPVDDGRSYSVPTYYVVGSSAGLYLVDGDGQSFVDGASTFVSLNDDGDRLPELLKVDRKDGLVTADPVS